MNEMGQQYRVMCGIPDGDLMLNDNSIETDKRHVTTVDPLTGTVIVSPVEMFEDFVDGKLPITEIREQAKTFRPIVRDWLKSIITEPTREPTR